MGGDKLISASLRRAAGLAVLWLVFAEGDLQLWWLGVLAVVAATVASLRLMPPRHYLRPLAVLAFAFFFLKNSLVSGLQVVRLALDPRRRPAPCCVDVTLTLPEGAPRLIVAGALGLMPGTLSVRLVGVTLSVHAIDANIPVAAEAAALEAQVGRMIGMDMLSNRELTNDRP